MKLSHFLKSTSLSLAFGALATSALAEGPMVELNQGETISLHFIDASHSQRGEFVNTVLPSAMDDIMAAGGRMVAKFETIDVEEGDVTPQHVVLMAWADDDGFNAAMDEIAPAAADLRAHTVGLFTVAQPVSFVLKDDVVYEWFAGNPAGPDTPNQLQTFFQNVIPTAMEYGRADAMLMQPVPSDHVNYPRMIAGMATWPTAASFEGFTNTDVFRTNIVEYRDPAFATLELINTYWVE